MKKRNLYRKPVNRAVMFLLMTVFQVGCAVQIFLNGKDISLKTVATVFGLYILTEWLYFLIWGVILRRKSFEIEIIAFFLTGLGLTITASVYPDRAVKQLISVCIGVAAYILMIWILGDTKRAQLLRVPAAVIAVGLLAATLLLAEEKNGAKNWIYIGSFSLQPAELVKVAFIFVGAATLDKIQSTKSLTKYILFAVSCVGILFLMKDFGAALIFFFTFVIIAFLRSGDIRTIFLTCAGALVGGAGVLVFKPYVARRFASYRHVWELANESGGYQQVRVLIYSVSGGLFGLGIGNGKLRSVFAATEDLVFGMLCEEFGMIIAFSVLLTFVALAVYSVRYAEAARSSFYSIAACAASGMLLFQAALNVFGVTDLLPLTGVTLPFVSRGGSSVICCWMLVAFIKAADVRTYKKYDTVRE